MLTLFLENNGTTTCEQDQQGGELGSFDLEIVVTASKSTNEGKHSKYQVCSDNDRFKIAKYSLLHGSRRAARKFKALFPRLNESTVRIFVARYNRMRKESNRSINSIPIERLGRPVMLGEIDTKVQAYIVSLHNRGGRISRTIVIAAAKAFASRSNDPSVRNIVLGETWAQSLFRRMGYKRRFGTTSKVPISNKARNEIELIFMHEIVQKVEKYNIPHSQILNADQTPSKYVPTACYTLAEKNSKSVPIAGGADRRAIPATFVEMLDCNFLPLQLIYGGKTSQSSPKIQFPTGFGLSANPSHYSNTEESIKLLKEIVVPYVEKIRAKLDDPKQSALLIWDVFRGQKTESVVKVLKENNIHTEYIPNNMTNYYQPLDLTADKWAKEFLKTKFWQWYSEQIQDA